MLNAVLWSGAKNGSYKIYESGTPPKPLPNPKKKRVDIVKDDYKLHDFSIHQATVISVKATEMTQHRSTASRQ